MHPLEVSHPDNLLPVVVESQPHVVHSPGTGWTLSFFHGALLTFSKEQHLDTVDELCWVSPIFKTFCRMF
jgi:hypothetical protein